MLRNLSTLLMSNRRFRESRHCPPTDHRVGCLSCAAAEEHAMLLLPLANELRDPTGIEGVHPEYKRARSRSLDSPVCARPTGVSLLRKLDISRLPTAHTKVSMSLPGLFPLQ